MNETKEFDSLPVLSEVREEREQAQKRPTIASVRVSPGPYLAIASVVTFAAALMLRAHCDAVSFFLTARPGVFFSLLSLSLRRAFWCCALRQQSPRPKFLHV